MFLTKINTYHAAAGERRQYREQTARLHAHRVTCVNHITYAMNIQIERLIPVAVHSILPEATFSFGSVAA
jgi:hypothetical protein